MRKKLLLVAAAATALAANASASPSRAACAPGHTFSRGGASGMEFCGPAKATANVGTKRYTFTNGSCGRRSKYFYLNLGTEVLSGAKGSYSYFGLLVGAYPGASPGTKASPKDGTFTGGLVTIRWKGKDFILNGAGDKTVEVTLRKGRTAGTFSGTTFIEPHLKVTGSFSC